MIALLATLPFVGAFWSHDLGALQRELQEDKRGGEEHLLFADLLALATCAPLPRIGEPSPLRDLVRLEEARRGTRHTIWDDLSKKDFFKRTPWNPDPRTALRWPDEAEQWPDEVLLVLEPPWKCASAPPGAGVLPLLQPKLWRDLPPEVAVRAAYERSVLRYRQGAKEGAAEIDAALLPPSLRPAARFLRLEAGVDSADGFIALAHDWPAPAIVMRAAQRLHELRRWDELVALDANAMPASLMQRHVHFLRALALHALGRDEEMLEPLARAIAMPGPEAGLEPLRALGIQALAHKPYDGPALAKIAGTGQRAVEQLARTALASGNRAAATDAARTLAGDADPHWRAQGIALAGEIAWRAGDAAAASEAFARMFNPAARLGALRDAAVLQLAQAMVVAAGTREPPQRRRLLAQLDLLKAQVHLRSVPQVETLLAAMQDAPVQEGEQPVAVGEVDVALTPAPPPAPAISIDLPEPRSLLAIPAPDGTLRDWFDEGDHP